MLPAATVRYSWRDETGSTGYSTAYVFSATTIDAARLAASELGGLLGAASGCSLHGYSVQYAEHLSDERGAPGARREDVLVLVLSDGADSYAVVQIPGVAGIYDEDGQADPDAPPVLGLAALLSAPPFCNPFGVVTPTLEAAYYEFDPT